MKALLPAALAAMTSLAHGATMVDVPGGPGGAGTVESVVYPVAPGTVLTFTNAVMLDLAAGDYLLTPAVAGVTPGAGYRAWNFQLNAAGSWGNHFVAGADLGNGKYQVLVDGATLPEPTCKNHFCAYDTEQQATDAWLATPAFHLHLAAPTRVGFVAADYYLPDNTGGISFTVSSVPEPASAGLMVAGALVLGSRRLITAMGAKRLSRS